MDIEEIRALTTQAAETCFHSEKNGDIAKLLENKNFKLTDLSHSSLKLVEFCLELEELLNISLEFSDVIDTPKISDFVNMLKQRIG